MTTGQWKREQMHPMVQQGAIPALSLLQPWASLVATGVKHYETRSWRTAYRGPLAIHASARPMTRRLRLWADSLGLLFPLPLGCVIATARLEGCWRTDASQVLTYLRAHPEEDDRGDFGPRRWAWQLANVRLIAPVTAKGSLGLWSWAPHTSAESAMRSRRELEMESLF